MVWDIYCRVIDNHGDVGVCWRLAADLAGRGQAVRLWTDDASALRWMAPQGAAGVTVRPWPVDEAGGDPGDVVIEAFGCALPDAVLRRLAAADPPPVWINLEYLSAEHYVSRVHRLPSPQSVGPATGLRKWFFYPGFTEATGGLLREPDLMQRRQAFDAPAWLARHDIARRPRERVVSLFCYEQAALSALIDALSTQPTLLLATMGQATRQVDALLGAAGARGGLRAVSLPPLTQIDYDALLWASDLNLVRGEDSFVRAQWAGQPFVWQAYPQQSGAHRDKIDAFLAGFLLGALPEVAASVRTLWAVWNGLAPPRPIALPAMAGWRDATLAWRDRLLSQPDLAQQLLGFAAETR